VALCSQRHPLKRRGELAPAVIIETKKNRVGWSLLDFTRLDYTPGDFLFQVAIRLPTGFFRAKIFLHCSNSQIPHHHSHRKTGQVLVFCINRLSCAFCDRGGFYGQE
jgi:hypothetical protein